MTIRDEIIKAIADNTYAGRDRGMGADVEGVEEAADAILLLPSRYGKREPCQWCGGVGSVRGGTSEGIGEVSCPYCEGIEAAAEAAAVAVLSTPLDDVVTIRDVITMWLDRWLEIKEK